MYPVSGYDGCSMRAVKTGMWEDRQKYGMERQEKGAQPCLAKDGCRYIL